MLPSQTVFLTAKYVGILWYSVMAVGWVRQQCRAKYCNDYCGPHNCVWPGAVVEDQHLTTPLLWYKLYTQASIQTSTCCNTTAEFYYYSLGKKFVISVLFSSQKTLARNRDAVCDFFILWVVVWRHYVDCLSDSGSEFDLVFSHCGNCR
jgi:hypothetical protein